MPACRQPKRPEALSNVLFLRLLVFDIVVQRALRDAAAFKAAVYAVHLVAWRQGMAVHGVGAGGVGEGCAGCVGAVMIHL